MADFLFLIPLLPLAAFCINFLLGRSMIRERAHWISIPAVLGSWIVSVLVLIDISNNNHAISQRLFTWIPSGDFNVDVSLYADELTAIMLLVVTTVGLLVHVYSVGYMHGDSGYYRFFSYLPLFVFSMLMLVLADNLLVLFVFWEAVGLCSYFLIGACGKSAQFPLHVWLPDAMEGPTPVSALIHAATMVTAGIYMVARSYT